MENKGFGGGKKGRGRTAASRIRRGAVAVLLFFVAVAALAGAVLFFLQRSGKSSLYNGADSSDLVGALSKMTAALGGGSGMRKRRTGRRGISGTTGFITATMPTS